MTVDESSFEITCDQCNNMYLNVEPEHFGNSDQFLVGFNWEELQDEHPEWKLDDDSQLCPDCNPEFEGPEEKHDC